MPPGSPFPPLPGSPSTAPAPPSAPRSTLRDPRPRLQLLPGAGTRCPPARPPSPWQPATPPAPPAPRRKEPPGTRSRGAAGGDERGGGCGGGRAVPRRRPAAPHPAPHSPGLPGTSCATPGWRRCPRRCSAGRDTRARHTPRAGPGGAAPSPLPVPRRPSRGRAALTSSPEPTDTALATAYSGVTARPAPATCRRTEPCTMAPSTRLPWPSTISASPARISRRGSAGPRRPPPPPAMAAASAAPERD